MRACCGENFSLTSASVLKHEGSVVATVDPPQLQAVVSANKAAHNWTNKYDCDKCWKRTVLLPGDDYYASPSLALEHINRIMRETTPQPNRLLHKQSLSQDMPMNVSHLVCSKIMRVRQTASIRSPFQSEGAPCCDWTSSNNCCGAILSIHRAVSPGLVAPGLCLLGHVARAVMRIM